jgi:hypothetical protein
MLQKKALVYALAIWVVPFVVAIMIFPIRISDRPLLESIMPVVVILCVVAFSVQYFRNLRGALLGEAVTLGLLWFLISIALDLVMFMPESPMRMSLVDYLKDIGLTYLIIPAITIGFGFVAGKR